VAADTDQDMDTDTVDMDMVDNEDNKDDKNKTIPRKSRSLRDASVQKRKQTELKLVSIIHSVKI
jgi:hypothetical protein